MMVLISDKVSINIYVYLNMFLSNFLRFPLKRYAWGKNNILKSSLILTLIEE